MIPKTLHAFRIASRGYSDASIFMHEAIARKAGLSGTDHKYLGFIMQNEKLTAGELSALTGLTTGAVTGLIDRLEKKNLVQRQFDARDRRKVFIIPQTENVEKLLTPLFADLQKKTSELLATFSDQEIGVIQTYFSAATAVMKSVAENLNKL